jgi:hypothetical protein
MRNSTEHLMFGDWKWKGLCAVRERRLLATWVDSIEQAGGRVAGASKALFTARFFQRALRSDRKQYSGPFTDRMGKLFEQLKPDMLGAFRTLLESLTRPTTPPPRTSAHARSIWTLLR